MNQNKIIKLAGAIKPPARKSEIIEALAIRKREQIIAENETLRKELDQLRLKSKIVAAEEALLNAKQSPKQDYYIRVDKQNDGRLEVRKIVVDYELEPSAELRTIARRIYVLEHAGIYQTPSLHEVRQQVRAKIMQQTPPDGRVKELLGNPMLEELLAKLDGKPQQALLAG